jgi:transcription elongation GreA/GreB family factor
MSNLEASLKSKLRALCFVFAEERIAGARQAIQQAQASANEETKSSSGDKYETGRAMAQLEIENSTGQLGEALKLKQALEQIPLDRDASVIQPGSVVYTNQGNYYIAISAGKLIVDGIAYVAISPASPIGARLLKLTIGASFVFNNKVLRVEKVE